MYFVSLNEKLHKRYCHNSDDPCNIIFLHEILVNTQQLELMCIYLSKNVSDCKSPLTYYKHLKKVNQYIFAWLTGLLGCLDLQKVIRLSDEDNSKYFEVFFHISQNYCLIVLKYGFCKKLLLTKSTF